MKGRSTARMVAVFVLLLFALPLLLTGSLITPVSAVTRVSVTQPVLVPTPPGSSPFTYTVTLNYADPQSGGYCQIVSGGSGTSGTVDNVVVSESSDAPHCYLRVTMPPASTDNRRVFASNADYVVSPKLCTSGICTQFSPSDWYQTRYTLSYSDGILALTLHSTQAGASYAAALNSSPTNYWLDYGAACSTTNPASASTSTKRWDTNTACGPVGGSHATIVFVYYYQFALVYSYSISGGGSRTAPRLTCTQFGSSYSPSLTTSATTYWCDNSQPWSVSPNPLTGSGPTERWVSSNTLSGTVSGTLTTVFTFVHQYAVSFAASPPEGGTTAPTGTNVWENAGPLSPLSIAAATNPYWSFTSWSASSGSITFTSATSESTTATIGGTGTITAGFGPTTPLSAGDITPSSPSITLGGSVTLTAHPAGGIPPYTYQWYTSSDCSSSPISGETSTTYLASPSSTTTYYYGVTDSGSPAASACSAGDTVALVSISLSPASGAVGTSVTITGSNFVASHSLTVSYGGSGAGMPTTCTTDASGNIASGCRFTVPYSTPGPHTVTVSDGTNSPTATFTVTFLVLDDLPFGTIAAIGVAFGGFFTVRRLSKSFAKTPPPT
ncbi:MAG: IPT/TIG domain-containing protein [Nitrososphaerales archaeon]